LSVPLGAPLDQLPPHPPWATDELRRADEEPNPTEREESGEVGGGGEMGEL